MTINIGQNNTIKTGAIKKDEFITLIDNGKSVYLKYASLEDRDDN